MPKTRTGKRFENKTHNKWKLKLNVITLILQNVVYMERMDCFFFLLHIYYINLLLTNQWNSNAISDNITCILHWTSKYLEGFMTVISFHKSDKNKLLKYNCKFFEVWLLSKTSPIIIYNLY